MLYSFNQAHDFTYGGLWIPAFAGMTRIEAGMTWLNKKHVFLDAH
jgi:hypothetical protein